MPTIKSVTLKIAKSMFVELEQMYYVELKFVLAFKNVPF